MKKIFIRIICVLLICMQMTGCSSKKAGAAVEGTTGARNEESIDSEYPRSTRERETGTYAKGDILYYGRYEQDNNTGDGAEPIEWIVLEEDGNSALAISRYCLDVRTYSTAEKDTTWETSDLRRWLNNDFFMSAFTEEERRYILDTEVENKDNPRYEGRGGQKTSDRVYVLSTSGAEAYFSDDVARLGEATAYIYGRGIYLNEDRKTSPWALRTSGTDNQHAAYVYSWGEINYAGESVTDPTIGVRPVIRLDISDGRMPAEKREAVPIEEAAIGDWITYGTYEQDNNQSNGAEPIEWQVIDIDAEGITAISRYCLDCHPYGNGDTTWETSELRRWLNEEFADIAFTEKEREGLRTSALTTPNNKESGSRGGNKTEDLIYVLSAPEAEQYFRSEATRYAGSTAYAKSRGVHVSEDNGNTAWWTRTPGADNSHAEYVCSWGEVNQAYEGDIVSTESDGVRPVIRIGATTGSVQEKIAAAPEEKTENAIFFEEKKTKRIGEQEQYEANIFLSNFSEQKFQGFDDEEFGIDRLIRFVELFYCVNRRNDISIDGYNFVLSFDDARDVVDRFFGIRLEEAQVKYFFDDYGGYYQDGNFYFLAGDGEAYNRFSVVSSIEEWSDGRLQLNFDIYELDIRDYYDNKGTIGREYYQMTAEQAKNVNNLTHIQSGYAIVSPFDYNGRQTYQLQKYWIGHSDDWDGDYTGI